MATNSSTLDWKIPQTEEPGRLQSMGLAKSWTRLSDFTFMHWRRKWQPTPVFLPGESQGRGSLVSCSPSDIHTYVHISEKAMAPHSSTLAWKIPQTEEPGRLQSMSC